MDIAKIGIDKGLLDQDAPLIASAYSQIHDEVVIEADRRMSLQAVCDQMCRTPPWANGLQLRADGYETDFYKKD